MDRPDPFAVKKNFREMKRTLRRPAEFHVEMDGARCGCEQPLRRDDFPSVAAQVRTQSATFFEPAVCTYRSTWGAVP